jgi:hypothetical protein
MKNRNLTFKIILSVLARFALSPRARATCQQGCLTNSNTVLGDDAPSSNVGIENTAVGDQAQVSVMLLNEFQKAHRKLEGRQATIGEEQKQQIKALSAGLKEQATQIQKVRERLATTHSVNPPVS